MTYKRFEDLPVWKSAMELAVQVYALTRHRLLKGPGDLRSQLRRAALSVSNNIAEGFERGTTAELLTFLYIARGSAGEVRSMLHFVERMIARQDRERPDSNAGSSTQSETSNLKSQISDLNSQAAGSTDQVIDGKRHASGSSTQTSGSSTQASGSSTQASGSSTQTSGSTAQTSGSAAQISDLKSQIPGPHSDLRPVLADLKSLAESCSRQIRGWAESLQNTNIRGQRHLTESVRNRYDADRRAEVFWQKVEAVVHARTTESRQ